MMRPTVPGVRQGKLKGTIVAWARATETTTTTGSARRPRGTSRATGRGRTSGAASGRRCSSPASSGWRSSSSCWSCCSPEPAALPLWPGVWFSSDTLVLTLAQAACVALPAAGLPWWLARLRSRGWALVLALNIAVVVVAIALIPTTADVLTWVALLLVPPGCALALGWAMHRARPPLAVLAAPLLAIAWIDQRGRAGEVAMILLIMGSCVTLGRLLAGAAPAALVKAGIVAMAASDAYLVFSNHLQAPNAVLIAAAPAPGLPRLQSAAFH